VLPVFEPAPTGDDRRCTEQELREEWVEWLKTSPVEMRWFVTLTFRRRDRSLDKAWRACLHWLRSIEDLVLRGQARRRGLPWIVTIERHRDGTPHAHILLAGTSNLTARFLASLWKKGFAKVARLDPTKDPLSYMVKDLAAGALLKFSRAVAPKRSDESPSPRG
jgi:hypothetical protein